ncbi:MAG: hypothetical protein DVB31_06390 [Verrucomicrobia bacterium]|nr:MAG: hypothetical protein DVB31_06390 [Verrucomicrobiota bacterium]
MTSPLRFTRREFSRLGLLAMGITAAGHDVLAVGSAEGPVRHRFLCCDYQGNRIAIVAADGTVEWDFAGTNPQDCWMLPNGNVLFCHRDGAREVSPQRKVVWEYKAAAGAQCHSCQPLPNGRVLVAECGLGRLVEAGRSGEVVRELKIASKAKNLGHQFRGTRRTADGHTWVCLMDEQKIVELGPDGAQRREIAVDGFPHAAVKLPDGNLLITLGPSRKVIELDGKSNRVWEIGRDEIPGNPLRLPAGCQRLPNGNTVVCNYLGGGFMGKQPQAFEVTRDKRVVWEFAGHDGFKTINQIQLLDLPAKAVRAGVLR